MGSPVTTCIGPFFKLKRFFERSFFYQYIAIKNYNVVHKYSSARLIYGSSKCYATFSFPWSISTFSHSDKLLINQPPVENKNFVIAARYFPAASDVCQKINHSAERKVIHVMKCLLLAFYVDSLLSPYSDRMHIHIYTVFAFR